MIRLFKGVLFLALITFAGLLVYGYARNHPEDLPWTELDLAQPPGMFTGRKLAALHDEAALCRKLLTRAGVRFNALPSRQSAGQCGYDEAVRFKGGGALDIAYRPSGLGTSCPVAAALALWEWNVLQPAAIEHFGQKIAAIDHFGSYNCRRMYGRAKGGWSEHATANAIDIAGFRLEDGRRITVVGDWPEAGPKGLFLRQVRDGACDLFATVLSPDYNAAHRDHLHLDQADRGMGGWRACR